MIRLNRIEPTLPPDAFRTFSVNMPLATHWRRATCEEVGCEAFLCGWVTTVPPESREYADLARACRGEIDGFRRGAAPGSPETTPEGFLRFTFPPGQPCLRASSHKIHNDEMPVFQHRGGDWRATTGRVVTHSTAESWRDELGENQLRIIEQRQRYGAE
jgi:hypothetical protein